ncbi:MAG: hypothetical protein HN348_30555 [Proteobacteria bacterium]|jgi:periplasmic protein TonB|nr:hypothetical protein [Pseudomonadota bacterium]
MIRSVLTANLLGLWSSAGFAGDIVLEDDTFVVMESGWAQVEVKEMSFPEPVGIEGKCTVALRLDDESGDLLVRPMKCPDELVESAVAASQEWVIWTKGIHYWGQPVGMNLNYLFQTDEVTLHLDETWLVSDIEDRPEGVHTSSLTLAKSVVPKYPPQLRGTGEEGICLMRVSINHRGVPSLVGYLECPIGFQRSAEKAVKRWRWLPPTQNGERVAAETTVKMHFKGQ